MKSKDLCSSWLDICNKNPYYEHDDIKHGTKNDFIKVGSIFFEFFKSKQKLYRINKLYNLLDFGSGLGNDSIFMSFLYKNVDCVDYCENNLKITKESCELLQINNISTQSVIPSEKLYNFIICKNVLPYYELEDQLQILKNLLSHLEMDGILCVSLICLKKDTIENTFLKSYNHYNIIEIYCVINNNGCTILEHDTENDIFFIKKLGKSKELMNLESKYVDVRDDILILNKYDIIDSNNTRDFHVCIYYIDSNTCNIIIRRLDSESGWDENITIKILDKDTKEFDIITVNPNVKNYLFLETVKVTNIILISQTTIEIVNDIPRRIVMTLDSENDLTLTHWNTIQSVIELNPEYSYNFYNAKDRRNFISENFEEDVLDMYDGYVPTAFQADVFRYCYLYIHGGCYIDCKMINRIPLREINNETECNMILTKDRIANAYQNNFIMCIPRHPLMKNAIDLCVKRYNVKFMKKVSFGSLYHTGPYLLYTAIEDFEYPDRKYVKIKLYFDAPFNNDYYKNYTLKCCNTKRSIFNTIYKDYYSNYKTIHKKPIWSELWAKNQVYFTNKQEITDIYGCKYYVYLYPTVNENTESKIDFLYDEKNDVIVFNSNSNKDDVIVKILNVSTHKFEIKKIYPKCLEGHQ